MPTLTGSVTEWVSILEKKMTVEEIVSSDIVGTNFGSVFDATQLVRVLDAVAKE